MRLDPYLRWAVYGALAALFVTGAAWLVADALKDSERGEAWQAVAANLLMLHGGGAMVVLVLYGALFPLHIRRGWRARNNRITGAAMVTFNALLAVTAFGLYYAGADELRRWIGNAHIAVGLALPILLLVHVLLGRRSTRTH